MNVLADLPISQTDWNQTPLSVQAVVMVLWQEPQTLKQHMVTLQNQVTILQAEVAKLREQVNKNSHNSSKPPSSDPPHQPTHPKREASGKKQGGQQGHAGKGRKLVAPGRVSRVVVSKPITCQGCGALLLGEDPHPQRHQVSELPRLEPEIIEYQVHRLACGVCGMPNQAAWPEEMPRGSFGERVQALIGSLGGRFGVSQRDMQALLETVFHVEIGLGSLPAQEKRLSQALEHPVQAAQAYVQQQAVVNLDETSWHEQDRNGWLWVGTTPTVTVFRLGQGRGAHDCQQVVGQDYAGIVGSDRYSAYTWLEPQRRQVCWAYLKRDFQAWVERGGASKTVGRLLLLEVKRFFGLWYRVRDGTLSRIDFQVAMHPIRKEVRCLLHVGTFIKQRTTRRTCQNILKLEQALWTFVEQEGVEPTNNAAERALRRGVIWRRRSFGTQSEAGSRFVERILTVVTTLRQQKRDVLDYLTAAGKARTLGQTAPSLLPAV